MGIRVRAGEATREFAKGNDPRGRPIGYLNSISPTLLRRHGGKRFIIPGAVGDHSLNDLKLLARFPSLSSSDAVALVIAARSYQNAMWIAESEPELAWLLLVSAIETAAAHWSPGEDPPSERLKASKPELYALLLEQEDKSLLDKVATIIAPSLGVTSKFLRFTLQHLPEPPSARPPKWCQVDWTPVEMRKVLSKVYSYRSLSLHTGRPFPAPMCEYPFYKADSPAFNETILGLAISTMGATWQKKDVPILLHVFEYITRGVLLQWWERMLPPDVDSVVEVVLDSRISSKNVLVDEVGDDYSI